MDINLNKSLEILKQTESLSKGDIKNLKQKDRKIISIAMSVILKSKGGSIVKDISDADLVNFNTHVTEKAPLKEQKSGLLKKLNKFLKNFFFRRISSGDLQKKMQRTELQAQTLERSKVQIQEEKGKVEQRIKDLEGKIKEDEQAFLIVKEFNTPVCKDILDFFNKLSKVKDKDKAGSMIEEKLTKYAQKEQETDDPDNKTYLQDNVIKMLGKIKTKIQLGLQNQEVKREIKTNKSAWSNTLKMWNDSTKKSIKAREKWGKELESSRKRLSELSNQESIIKLRKT